MCRAAKVGQRAVRIANSLVNLFILTVILLLISFSAYAIWDSNQIHSAASAENYERYKPTVESETASFADLQAINPEVFAWLTVYGTNIDYPLVQGPNNLKYINTDARGGHALSGAIFIDYRSSQNFSDFSTILYGHHMENQVMFGEIPQFSDPGYFNARRYGALYADGRELGLEFFAFLHADAYDFEIFRVNIREPETRQAYLNLLLEMATHTRPDVSVTVDDRIVLLSTCSPGSTNGRDILVAKISDTVYSNPFDIEEMDNFRITPQIGSLPGLWEQAPLWMKAGLAAMVILLMLSAAVLIYTKLNMH